MEKCVKKHSSLVIFVVYRENKFSCNSLHFSDKNNMEYFSIKISTESLFLSVCLSRILFDTLDIFNLTGCRKEKKKYAALHVYTRIYIRSEFTNSQK